MDENSNNNNDLKELEEKFYKWKKDEISIETFEEEDPDEIQQKNAFRMIKRFLFILVLSISIFSLFFSYPELVYFLKSFDKPIDLGDLREKIKTTKTIDIPSNSWVTFKNAIITRETTSKSGKYNFFYCPLYHIIVRTPKPLPPKIQGATTIIPEHLYYLVDNKHIFPFDLTASFDGNGRMFKKDDAPKKYKGVIEYYTKRINVPPEEVYLFIDGNKPMDNLNYALLFVFSLFALIIGLIIVIKKLKSRKETS